MIKTYPVNEAIAGVVPMPTQVEQDVLTKDIEDNGLLTPILLWKGHVVDGRCRQAACVATNTEIRTESLEWTLDEDEVKTIVKSLNTRRNLTMTQKATTALKVYLEGKNIKLYEAGEKWGVSQSTMKAINYIYKISPDLIAPLFNGDSVSIQDARGNWVKSNKINSICQHLKRIEESSTLKIDNPIDHEWSESTYIKMQAGKDWYLDFVNTHGIVDIHVRRAIAELANFRFTIKD